MPISRHFLRTGCVVVGLVLATVSMGSCDLAKNQLTYDRGNNKDIQDYRDGLSPEHTPTSEAASPLPEFQSVVATPSDLRLPSPLVTVSVNQTVSLHDLMFELAEQAGIDLEMDPDIHGSIIFTAKDRPFNDVVDRICEMAGLRYTFKNNVMRIQLDRPYVKDYKVNYMSTSRKNVSNITTGISSSVSGSAAGATSSKNGSDATVNNANNSDFWNDVDAGLKQLLSASDTYTSMASQSDPVAVPEPPPPPPLGADGKPVAMPASNVPPSLNVSAAPSAPVEKSAPGSYSISRETGIVSVFATERQQKLVQKFFDGYRRQAMAQVLIEAKVLEVTLNDQYSSGIDWGVMSANLTRLIPSLQMNFPSAAITSVPAVPAGSVFTTNLDLGHGFKPVISALTEFGTVRALSSPRITVMNNQSAVVNVATNLIYFSLMATVTPATTTSAATVSYTTTQQSVPQGVLMNVTPTVNPDTGEIVLAVRPTVSRQVDHATDPGVVLNVAGTGGTDGLSTYNSILSLDPTIGQVPVMSVQEMDSIIKMQSGQTMVMGGLMKDGNQANQTGIPVLGDIPGIGNLFHSHSDNVVKQELVIFIKASIVPGSNVQDMDRKVYKQFGDDTRPFSM